MLCKLCNKDKILIDSHIIPKFFFKYLYPDNKIQGESLQLVGGPRGVSLKSRTGLYEKLLCVNCDNKIGYYDNYAKSIFIDGTPEPYPKSDKAYLIRNVNYKSLKLFLISLLWRSSISSLSFFSRINVGPYEGILHNLLAKENQMSFDDFPFFIVKYDAGKLGQVAEKNIQDPVKIKIDGVNFSLFFLPNCYEIYIKIDRRPLPYPFDKIVLKNDGGLIILRKGEYANSGSFKTLLNTI